MRRLLDRLPDFSTNTGITTVLALGLLCSLLLHV